MSEKGAKSIKWATSKCSARSATGSSVTSMHALAYRSGLGNVVLCNTSVKAAGLEKSSYVSKSGPRASSGGRYNDFERFVVMLTECQRTPDWFLRSQLCITGLAAIQILRVSSKFVVGCDGDDVDNEDLAVY